MKLRCRLREYRGPRRTLRDIQIASGVAASVLSQLERGRIVPTDEEIKALEPLYGPIERWYDWRGPLLVVDMDETEEAA